MIEVHYKGKAHAFASSEAGVQIKETLGAKECIGFIDKETKTIYDLHSYIFGPISLEVLDKDSEESIKFLRASLGMILSSVVGGCLMDIELTNDGFTCKIDIENPVSENDFAKIKKNMIKLIDGSVEFEKYSKFDDEDNENEDSKSSYAYKFQEVTLESSLPFFMKSSQCSKHFEIRRVAQELIGETKVQKLTVSAFRNEKDLANYLEHLELLKKNDHRVIGKQMELFDSIPEAAGSVFWLPNGYKLFKALESFIRKVAYDGYNEVRTPLVLSSNFWEKSGHMAAYKANMMHIHMGEGDCETAAIKPMNCPGHIEIFKQKRRSYKELPVRIAEFGICHRYEPSGALLGLMRVRSFTMDDGHIFCAREQIQSEVEKFMIPALKAYKFFGFDDITIKVATRPEGFLGNIENWDFAEKTLQDALKSLNLDYIIAQGEGAFYGPKIEIHVSDSMGRSWQLGTIQLDFVLPERFDLSYVDKDDQYQVPCMLHRALVGSMERFIGVLLEHTGGNLPIQFAPVQAVICTVVSSVDEYAKAVHKKLTELDIRVELDDRSETLGYKIRDHKQSKVPMLIIIGKDEMNNKIISVEYNAQKFTYEFDAVSKIMEHFSYER